MQADTIARQQSNLLRENRMRNDMKSPLHSGLSSRRNRSNRNHFSAIGSECDSQSEHSRTV